MPPVAIIGLIYVGIGAIFLLRVSWEDQQRTDISVTGFLSALSSIWGLTELLFIVLWPIWATIRWWPRDPKSSDDSVSDSDHKS